MTAREEGVEGEDGGGVTARKRMTEEINGSLTSSADRHQ